MPTFYTDEMIDIIKNEYPNCDNRYLSKKLGISVIALRCKASKLGIKKNTMYMNKMYSDLQIQRKLKQEQNYKEYMMTDLERNIIIGSLIGDGTLSLYGRSKNAYYRENTGKSQINYRRWKLNKLKNLDFKAYKNGGIYSPSHPIYTELYNMFYPNNKKTLTKENIELLNHPIGLACLFMDDGSLVITHYKKVKSITLCPQIYLYSQSFSLEENILLRDHIQKLFNIEFIVSKRKDGTNYLLSICKRNEINSLIDIISPFVEEIPTMKYKININQKLMEAKKRYSMRYKDKIIKFANAEAVDITYSLGEEKAIIEMYKAGKNCAEIAKKLERPYYGLYDKVRRMKAEGKF